VRLLTHSIPDVGHLPDGTAVAWQAYEICMFVVQLQILLRGYHCFLSTRIGINVDTMGDPSASWHIDVLTSGMLIIAGRLLASPTDRSSFQSAG